MLYAVIMAGGSGTRLWPESRRLKPKQLLRLTTDRTMIQATVDRLEGLIPPDRIIVATTHELAPSVQEQLSQLPRDAILAEPCPRNTAPCIGLAAIRIIRDAPEAVMAVMPADHAIEPAGAFQAALRQAERLVEARPGRLVTFGIKPTYPAESFGYIERGEPLAEACAGDAPAFTVSQFHEKPDRPTAAEYLAAGTYYWNSGIFVWKARTIRHALARYESQMSAHLDKIAAAVDLPGFDDVLQNEFAAIEGKSIDYAVMERHDDVAVIEAPFTWDDVGSWRAIERLRPPGEHGNRIDAARCLTIDASGTIVRVSDPRHVVALLGVRNLIVISTPDATLIADRESEESVRQIIAELKRRGWDEYL